LEEQRFIHSSSYIDEAVEIGKSTKVWHFCHIMSKAKIGDNCVLGQNVMIASNVILGNNVKVQNNVSIYEGVKCEDDVFIGPSVVFTNVMNPRSAINRKNEFKKTRVKKGASLGANSTIICGNDIGRYAFIGAGAVVNRDVLDYELVVGNPIQHKGWMSRAGIKLQFEKTGIATCSESGKTYTLKDNIVFEN
jgi:UDP-2-acetamido-3-amino-2,3-dideoxy-glucuronate N-acetyltransferase